METENKQRCARCREKGEILSMPLIHSSKIDGFIVDVAIHHDPFVRPHARVVICKPCFHILVSRFASHITRSFRPYVSKLFPYSEE